MIGSKSSPGFLQGCGLGENQKILWLSRRTCLVAVYGKRIRGSNERHVRAKKIEQLLQQLSLLRHFVLRVHNLFLVFGAVMALDTTILLHRTVQRRKP